MVPKRRTITIEPWRVRLNGQQDRQTKISRKNKIERRIVLFSAQWTHRSVVRERSGKVKKNQSPYRFEMLNELEIRATAAASFVRLCDWKLIKNISKKPTMR